MLSKCADMLVDLSESVRSRASSADGLRATSVEDWLKTSPELVTQGRAHAAQQNVSSVVASVDWVAAAESHKIGGYSQQVILDDESEDSCRPDDAAQGKNSPA